MKFVIAFAILINTCLIWHIFKSRKINDILAISILFYSALWLVVPGFGLLFLENMEYQDGDIDPAITRLYALETALFCASLITFFIFCKASNVRLGKVNPVIFYVLAAVYCIATIHDIANNPYNYSDGNDLSIKTPDGASNFYFLIYSLLSAMFTYLAIKLADRMRRIIAIFLVVLATFSYVLTGARIALLWPIFLITVDIFKQIKTGRDIFNRKLLVWFLILVLFVFGLMGVAQSIEMTRLEKTVSASNLTIVPDFKRILNNLNTKFNSFQPGLHLINGYGAGAAGFRPYWGSFAFFVPRLLYPNKPIAGSIDDTYFGTPARLVPTLLNAGETVSNVGVSPLAISVWHWGWLIGPIIIFITALLEFYLLNFLLNSSSLILNSLGVFFIPIPGFVNIFQSPDVVIKNIVLTLVIVAFMKLRFISNSKNSNPHNFIWGSSVGKQPKL